MRFERESELLTSHTRMHAGSKGVGGERGAQIGGLGEHFTYAKRVWEGNEVSTKQARDQIRPTLNVRRIGGKGNAVRTDGSRTDTPIADMRGRTLKTNQ